MEVSGHWLAHPSYGTQVPPSNEKVRLILVTENNLHNNVFYCESKLLKERHFQEAKFGLEETVLRTVLCQLF